VAEVDWSVGEVMAALQRAGVADNTLVLFTSDNGPWYEGSPGAFRGRKGQSFEGGQRVPMLVWWPGHVPANSVTDVPATNVDLFPTCLALAGLDLPADRVIDGEIVSSLFTAPDQPFSHGPLYFYHEGELEGVSEGQWKYFRSINHYVWPLPVNKKLGDLSRQTKGPLPLLFNLETDPGESYDVSMKYPDMARDLDSRMEQWDQAMQSNRKGWRQPQSERSR
jgi:uncharacterized sulfatase